MSEIRNLPEIFGSDVFNEYTMKQRLPEDVFGAWKRCIAEGTHRIAYPQCGGIAELGGGQIGAVNAQHRQIGNGVAANQPCAEAAVVGELHGNDLCILHHMGIGYDISVSREHHPGAGGRTAAALTGDGHHGRDVQGVDILQSHAAALGNIVDALGRRLKVHGGIGKRSCHGGRGLLCGKGLLRGFLGRLRGEGDGQLLMLLPVGFQLPEQANIQQAQHGDDAAQRVAEAAKLGFRRCILPSVCMDAAKGIKGIELVGVSNVREALEAIQ